MADPLVEHRFVQIYQACERASSRLDDFCNTLAQTSAIAVSHGCEKVYARVTQSEKDLDLVQTLHTLQNLILTNDDAAKNSILLRTITQLLIFNQQQATDKANIQFHHCKTDVQQVHPYATLMRQKPSLYFDLLEEVDYLMSQHASAAMPIAQGFVAAIFLTDNTTVDANALLIRLVSAIMTNSNMMADVYACMTDILVQYPMQKESDRYLSLVDFLMWITIVSRPYCQQLQITGISSSTTDYLYPFMDRLVTASSQQHPIMSYLARLERMVAADGSDAMFADVIWVCLAYVLLNAHSVTEQQAILRLMKAIHAKVSGTVSRIAYLPLYQLLSELNDKEASAHLKALKDDTLNMLHELDYIQQQATATTTTGSDPIGKQHVHALVQTNSCIYGLLAHLVVYLDGLYHDSIPVLNHPQGDSKAGPDITLTLDMLFSTPHVYDADVDTQCLVLSRITELSSSLTETACCKFPMLLFLLRLLRTFFDQPRLVAHLFKNVIPLLADPNDPTLTSKVLQVILSSISSGDTMASLGVKALAHTHQRQPRVWQELKRVFAEWVLRRKSGTVRRRKLDLSVSGPIKLELAVLTTMRDVCKTKPRECAPDVLPMVMSLLQTCQDLSMASLSVLMATINHCATAGLVEPRSIWNIAVVYLAQFAVDQGTQKSALLVQELCTFYSIAGARNDASEPYLQFKEHLLAEFILPLIDSDDTHAAQHAMLALASFSAQDMATVLPEKATDYVHHATPANDRPIEHQDVVLATLMSNELDHMRRGLFKQEEEAAAATSHKKTATVSHTTNDAGHVVGEREAELQALLTQLWQDARVAPGLRSGYAIAMLHTLQSQEAPPKTLQDMSKTQWYRFMVTSFTDVSLTDHLLLRVSSIGSWKSFFQNTLANAKQELEAVVSVLIQDLVARLERSTVPGVTCNIAMAITGLVLVVQLYTPSYAASCANDMIEMLMKNYIVLSGSPLSHSAHLMSEEVQFAARFALGHLATCIISNDKVVQEMHQVLLDAATTHGGKYRNMDTSVDLVQFANGYAAGHFVASLAVYPTMTESIQDLKTTGLASLQQYYTLDGGALDSRVVGILMGLASKLTPTQMGDALDITSTQLKAYLNGNSISKGLLLGSTWVVALGALQEHGVEYEYSSIIESVMAAASRDPTLAQHFYHFVVPYTHIVYHSYVHADANDNETAVAHYTQAFEPLFGSIQSDDASSNYRIASLFGVASLLGVDYLNRNATSDLYTEAQRYEASSRRAGLDKLAAITGLTVKSAAPTGNLKSGRIAAAACGKVLAHTHLLMQALLTSADQSTADASVAALASASSEPINYNRLNSNTSYLRAVFDKLTQLASDDLASNKHTNNIAMLLKGLIKTPGPLPPVNWFALLLKLSKVSPDMQQLCFLFASTHAATCFSLSEYLATQMTALLKEGNSTKARFLFETLDGDDYDSNSHVENAFGTLLMLGGLPRVKGESKQEAKRRRGMNAVTKKMSISSSRILELLKLLAERFSSFDQDIQYAILSTLADHLPSSEEQLDQDKSKFVSSVYTLIFETVISQLLGGKSTTEKVLRQAVACTHTESIEQLLPTGRLEDWDDISPTINYLVYLCESYHLSRKKQHTIKYISTAMTYLIGQGVSKDDDDDDNCWRVVADMIADDCQTDQDALGWIIRVLDAFVVYLSSFRVAEQFDQDVFMKAIHTGLHTILTELRLSPEDASVVPLQIADTAYLLGYFIGIVASEHKTEQEQIVKRIFKLLGMVRHLESSDCTDFFKHVVLGMPSVYLLQY